MDIWRVLHEENVCAVCRNRLVGGLFAQQAVSLFDAVEQTARAMARDIPAGNRVAIMMFDAENDRLSNLLIEELTSALQGKFDGRCRDVHLDRALKKTNNNPLYAFFVRMGTPMKKLTRNPPFLRIRLLSTMIVTRTIVLTRAEFAP